MASEALDRQNLLAAYDAYEALAAKIASASHDVLTLSDLQWIATRRERVTRAQGAVDHKIVTRIAEKLTPQTMGGNSMRDILVHSLRISRTEAERRLADAEEFGPRRALNGEPLPPKLPATAASQARGEVGTEHVRVIRKFFAKLPDGVAADDRDRAEELLGRSAARLTPEELRKVAERLLMTIDQDGPEPRDNVRARRRGLWFGKQDSDGMTRVTGWLDPEARAVWDANAAKTAAPGMCNPDDENACVDDEPDREAVIRDLRTTAQRNHDAFKAIGRAMLASGQLGQHRGLPCTVVVTTTLDKIESGEGWAVTGGGSLLPMADVIRLAGHAYHYLCIYKSHTEIPLYLGRTKRIASPGQRIAVMARDGGCTRPGCTAPPYWCQVHHRDEDWADGGPTDVDNLTLACQPDHRLLTSKGWRTQSGKDGRTEWIPPPILDVAQPRVNDCHRPERYLSELEAG
ncbi:HNH endonuclease [Mycolicibacterium septicum DSM 44393]|uniref:HNH endonuclease n=1 Tax=Mycolicibacterium septicum DSM 44393 TaxID=1341646 RepID=A0A7X6MPX6_9MYCO|nr:HNH endonuclease signature motif containing protein [Mycolicibacterium septicum]NKZ12341.1 HNH endonuclease [Mycolicibacterium septicum DSM 44393]